MLARINHVKILVRISDSNMTELNAENIENILTDYLGGKFPIAKIEQKKFDGNNSNHLRKLVVTLKGKNAFGKDEIYIEAVAKLFPESKFSKDMNYTKSAMKKEINFYKTVLPRLQEFQRQNYVEVFTGCPEYIASRLNMNGSREIDSEAVLLLQDLEEEGKHVWKICIKNVWTTATLFIIEFFHGKLHIERLL